MSLNDLADGVSNGSEARDTFGSALSLCGAASIPHMPTSPAGGADITSWHRVLLWADGVGGGGAWQLLHVSRAFPAEVGRG